MARLVTRPQSSARARCGRSLPNRFVIAPILTYCRTIWQIESRYRQAPGGYAYPFARSGDNIRPVASGGTPHGHRIHTEHRRGAQRVGQAAALRHRRLAVRRPRCRHQHHAPPDPGAGRRGDPPRPQPRRARDVVRAALQEDADGIAYQSYQGGHTEYFRYMVDMLRETRRRAHPRVRRRRRHHHARKRSTSCRPTASSASTTPTTACRWAWSA